ncbi:MAG: hypothetical protein JW920_11730 [Deltaproteobacteria bacterium]|nr:hypothetical protein [Deltaproteobacteria bacterium]
MKQNIIDYVGQRSAKDITSWIFGLLLILLTIAVRHYVANRRDSHSFFANTDTGFRKLHLYIALIAIGSKIYNLYSGRE